MSTRCQIAIYDQEPKLEDIEHNHYPLIYIHGDGNPENILPLITPKIISFKNIRGYYDPEYMLARLIQHIANTFDEQTRKLEKEYQRKFGELSYVLGIGVKNEFNGDLSFVYTIGPSTIKVYQHIYKRDATFVDCLKPTLTRQLPDITTQK